MPRRDRDADLRRELEDHLDLEAEAMQRPDESLDAARRRARLAFGNPVSVAADVRREWFAHWLASVWHDARHAVRVWRATPGLSLVAVTTMAVGIGASTALFGQMKAVFWTPLAVHQPHELRQLAWTAARFPYVSGGALNVLPGPTLDGGPTFASFSYNAYEAMRDDTTSFSSLGCWGDFGEARPVALGALGFGTVQFVSGNLLGMLGVVPALGRTIAPEDDLAETWAPVAMLGHRLWQARFGGALDVTRQSITLNGRTFAIVGVLPATFAGLDPAVDADVVVPIGAVSIAAQSPNPLRNPGLWTLCRVVGRVQPTVTDAQASAEATRLVGAAVASQGVRDSYDPPSVHVLEGAYGLQTLRQAASLPLTVLLGGVGVLLLAASANVASLLLARGDSRTREIVTRLALGADRGRLVRQLVTESLVLSCVGGVLGVVLAFQWSKGARSLLSQFLPTLFGADRQLAVDGAPDAVVLVGALVAMVGCGVFFGLAPALRATRRDIIGAIRQGSVAGAHQRSWAGGRTLVAMQAALAIVLLMIAGTFVRTWQNLRAVDLGVAADRLLYARVEPRSANLPRDQRGPYFRAAIDRLARLPGVAAVSAATPAPLGGDVNVGATLSTTVCEPVAASGTPVTTEVTFIAPGYFAALDAALRHGRDFTWNDAPGPGGTPVIVSASFARAVFGERDAVGQVVRLAPNCDASAGPRATSTVIGVADDVRRDPRMAQAPAAYWPLAVAASTTTLLVRTEGPPAALISTVRAAVAEVNRDIPSFDEATLADLRERAFRRERLMSSLLGAFATATALVTALGIHGMLSYHVRRRRSEFGIRMALGADTAVVARMVLVDVLHVLGVGVVLGLGAAFAVGHVLRTVFFGVAPSDPMVAVAAIAALVVVAAVASAAPMWAVTRIDPLRTLREP